MEYKYFQFLFLPNKELSNIDIKRIPPPNIVDFSIFSPRNTHTQNGPNNTSVKANKFNSAAFITLDPNVYRAKPAPTWKTPISREIFISFEEIIIFNPKLRQIKIEINTPIRPENKTAGSISPDLPNLKDKVNIEKPNAEASADKFPFKAPE